MSKLNYLIGIVALIDIWLLALVILGADKRVTVAYLPYSIDAAAPRAYSQNCVLPSGCQPTAAPPSLTSTPLNIPIIGWSNSTPGAVATTPPKSATPVPTSPPEPSPTSEPPTATPTPAPVGVIPSRIKIPTIGVDAGVEQVGTTPAGLMALPPSIWNVGWYKAGTKPGALGSAVIAGHYDNVSGPAVFWNLKNIKPGNKIYLTGSDGKQLTFEVYEVASYPFDNAPLDRIFGSSDQPQLNLVTCTGNFDFRTHNYDHRLIIYSRLVQ